MTDEQRERLEREREADGIHTELAMMRAVERHYDPKNKTKDTER